MRIILPAQDDSPVGGPAIDPLVAVERRGARAVAERVAGVVELQVTVPAHGEMFAVVRKARIVADVRLFTGGMFHNSCG